MSSTEPAVRPTHLANRVVLKRALLHIPIRALELRFVHRHNGALDRRPRLAHVHNTVVLTAPLPFEEPHKASRGPGTFHAK